jgi:hypothetical protein
MTVKSIIMTKVYHLEFNEPMNDGETSFFFGSLTAIYEHFTPSQIGCGVNRLWNIGVAKGTIYKSDKCTITPGCIERKPGGRGKRSQE